MQNPWNATRPRLVGKSVDLRPLDPVDTPDLFLAGQAPEIWEFVPMRIRTPEDMAAYVAEACMARDEGRAIPFVIRDRITGRILGCTRYYDLQPVHLGLEIGYTWLVPSAWRTSVNTECKFLLLRHAFETLGCVRVALRTGHRNMRSQRAIERLGAVREGVLRNHMIMPDGSRRDTVYYSIVDSEWPAIKARLAERLEARETGAAA
jgi:RimJ/RimL family protein N-acetyltransferase